MDRPRERLLALLLACLAAHAAPQLGCSCGTNRPCQHNGGDTCYPVVKLASGDEACPGDTTHCACPCSAAHPCKHGDMCVSLTVVFGVDSCPYGSTRCHVAAGTTGQEQMFAPTPAPAVAAPHGFSTNVCRCAGSKPCSNAMGACVAEEATGLTSQAAQKRCPGGSKRCHCACLDTKMPCQHELLDICMPDFDDHGTRTCPVKSVRCVEAAVSPTPAPTPEHCVCGGGKPCQLLSAPHTCTAMGHASANDATLTCAPHTQLCSCACLAAERPCQYWNDVLEKSFCFSKEYDRARLVMACPASTATCVAHDAHTGSRTIIDELHKTAAGHTPVDSSLLAKQDCLLATPSGWSAWSACTKECGSGEQKKLPLVKTPASNGGAACPAPLTRTCNEESCDAVDCVVSGWTDWSACSQNCHGGLMRRQPIITQHPNRKGKQCPKPVTKECNKKPCAPELHCKCNPMARTLDPDAPPPGKGEVQCQRVQTEHGARVKVLHPPMSSYFKCAYRQSSGCQCCMCYTKTCEDGAFSGWGDCTQQYFLSGEGEDESAGAKCPCPDIAFPCRSATSGACLAEAGGTCPAGSAVCAGRLLHVRERSRDIVSSVFLTDPACPQLAVYEMCGTWASDVSASTPTVEQIGAATAVRR